MTTAVSIYATQKLCENQGCLDFKQFDQIIGQTFTVDDGLMLGVLCNDRQFAIKEGKERALGRIMKPDSLIVAKTTLRVCQSPPGKCLRCDNLHLCRYFVCGNCRFGNKCKNAHRLDSPNNISLLRGVGLQDLREDELFHLLLQNDPYLLPEVCSHYNKGIGEHGMCRFSTTCTNLHLCLHFLKDDCRFGPACKRAHTLNDQATKVLTGRGFSPKNILNLNKIYRNKFIILGEVPAAFASPASAARERINKASVGSCTPSSSAPSAPGSSPISEAERNEICLFFIRRHCSFKEKCVRVHYHLPYKWQVLDRDGGTWEDLPDMEVIEKAYCDPGKSTSTSADQRDLPGISARVSDFLRLLQLRTDGDLLVNFVTMRCDGREVRRLSTASSVTKPPHFVLTTQWLWYWKDELDQWHQYGQEAGGDSQSSITSKTLENVYLADTETDIQFKAGKHSYVLSFKGMCQQNTKFKTKREVRRRPVFVSAQDVEAKLKSVSPEGPGSSSSSSSSSAVDVPSHWDKSPGSLPDFFYKLVPLSCSTKEYKMVEKLFVSTMASSTIHSIQRNQNTSLWRVFHWQKEQMKVKNGGKTVDERYLFHGTDESAVEAICEQNLDWRECGLNGTHYGMGSYFARDAVYSHAYAKSQTTRKKMFVALVLVGEFVKGNRSYRKPPAKGTSNIRYDSCVDREASPSIFVVFEKQQIYPEYVIDYS
ncbi:protein mono-ADP-ribosyltransferase PARP12-like [Aplochiton taeniatus]